MVQVRPFSALFRRTLAHRARTVQSIHHDGVRISHFSQLAFPSRPFATLPPTALSSEHRSFLSAQITAQADPSEQNELPRFEDIDNLHPYSKRALKNMGLEEMTEIQAKTFDAAASGKDVLARARTGTGKTMAFLLPSLERILQNPIKGQVNMLILAPTRELASQIAEQTRQLISSHNDVSYQVMFGGASRNRDIARLEQRVPTILVATPGRIQDHFENTYIRDKRFSTLFHRTQLLVLDEMDRLLDMGFRSTVEQIITYLPLKRQTLLFSATLPLGVKQVIQRNLAQDFVTVDCIHDEDPTTHTNDLVEQSHVIVPNNKLVMSTVGILLNIMQDPNAKLICFFPTTKMVKYYAELFNHGLGRTVMELHSGKSQAYRTGASNRFRQVKKGVMFTSDVSARGVDYKDVTHVVQVGLADSRETYIHRLGRTARAGKKGHGLLILSEIEQGFLRQLQGLDIDVDEEMQQLVDSPPADDVLKEMEPVLDSIRTGRNKSLQASAQQAYRGMMGYYQGQLKRIGIRSPEQLVQFVNDYSKQTGLDTVPTLTARAARNMGIYGAPGLLYAPEDKRGGRGSPNNRDQRSNKRRNGSTSRRRSAETEWAGQRPSVGGEKWSPWS